MIAPQNDDVIAIVSRNALTKWKYQIRCYVNWAILNDFFTIERRIVVGYVAETSMKNILSHEFRWKDTNWWNCKWRRGKKYKFQEIIVSSQGSTSFSLLFFFSSLRSLGLALNRFVKKLCIVWNIFHCRKWYILGYLLIRKQIKVLSSCVLNTRDVFFSEYEYLVSFIWVKSI